MLIVHLYPTAHFHAHAHQDTTEIRVNQILASRILVKIMPIVHLYPAVIIRAHVQVISLEALVNQTHVYPTLA